MEALQGVGNVVGEYAGDGQGETENVSPTEIDFYTDIGEDDDLSVEQTEVSSDDAHPLYFLYDCESTGLSIYSDHIIEIAAEVVNSPVTSSNTTFASLVKTSRRIPTPGKKLIENRRYFIMNISHQDHQHHTHHDPG